MAFLSSRTLPSKGLGEKARSGFRRESFGWVARLTQEVVYHSYIPAIMCIPTVSATMTDVASH